MFCWIVSLALVLMMSQRTIGGPGVSRWTLRERSTIGREAGAEIYSATGIAVDDAGAVYVSDQLEYCVKKFTPRGRPAGRTGKRGSGPGEFRAPVTVVAWKETLLVMQMDNPVIQAFSRDLIYLGSRTIEGGIPVDIAVSPRGELLVATLAEERGGQRVLVFPSLLGGRPAEIATGSGDGGHILFGVCKVTGGRDGSVVVVSPFLNRIEWYSRAGELLARVSVPGVGDGEGAMRGGGPPTGTCFKGIQTDPQGNILLLAGSLARNPGVDVFVLSPRGKFIGVMKLRRPSRLLVVDRRGHLFAAEEDGTVVKEYIPSSLREK